MWNDPLSHWFAWMLRTGALKYRNAGRNLRVGWMATARSCTFGRYNTLYEHVVLDDVVLGDMSYLARGTRVANATIGRYACIGPDVLIGLGRHPTRDFVSSHPAFYSLRGQAGRVFVDTQKFEEFRRVTIGNDVWIGARAIVLDGATIGDGAIVAAGAVVSGEVPPYAIVSGTPAKLVRYRFDEATITAIRASAWWDLDFDVLQANADAFADPAAFVAWQAGARAVRAPDRDA